MGSSSCLVVCPFSWRIIPKAFRIKTSWESWNYQSNHARHEELSLRQLYVFPDAPLMLVAHVRRLNGIRLRLGLENDVDDVAQGDIVDMRSMAAAPAEVQAHLLFG